MPDDTDAASHVAVVLRTRDRPPFLRRALTDILVQTYPNYSVVVVNDAGDLGSVLKIVTELTDESPVEVKVEHNEESKGREAAMNTGVRASKSAYITMHDDDDTWAPTFLERTVAYLQRSADVAVATRAQVVYEHLDGDTIIIDRRETFAADKSEVTLAELLRRNFVPTNSLLYRREALDEIGFYDETLPVLADWDFLLRLALCGQIGFLAEEPLAYWHHREGLTGSAGNSVFTGAADHKRYDGIIRDRYLRADVARSGGTGMLLYQSALLDDMSVREDARTAHIAHVVDVSTTDLRREVAQLNQSLVGHINQTTAQLTALADQLAALERLVFSQTPRARLRAYRELSARYLERLRPH